MNVFVYSDSMISNTLVSVLPVVLNKPIARFNLLSENHINCEHFLENSSCEINLYRSLLDCVKNSDLIIAAPTTNTPKKSVVAIENEAVKSQADLISIDADINSISKRVYDVRVNSKPLVLLISVGAGSQYSITEIMLKKIFNDFDASTFCLYTDFSVAMLSAIDSKGLLKNYYGQNSFNAKTNVSIVSLHYQNFELSTADINHIMTFRPDFIIVQTDYQYSTGNIYAFIDLNKNIYKHPVDTLVMSNYIQIEG